MISIHFPNHSFKIKTDAGKDLIFDELRKQWLVLTPEEWVRQNFIQYLIENLHYPKTLMAVEKEVGFKELQRRFDIAVYNRETQPWMLIECKAMDVPLADKVTDQALRYNQKLGASYLVITNGSFTRCFQLLPQVMECAEMPVWPTA